MHSAIADSADKSFKRFFSTLGIFRWTFALAVLWQISLLIIGIAIDPHQGTLGHVLHWDANWYKHIVEYGYTTAGSPAAPAFYPLYPSLLWLLLTVTFGLLPFELIGLIINTLSLWVLLIALVKILQVLKVGRVGIIGTLLALFTFPSALFMHVLYNEALFMAIGFSAYLFALKRKWWAVGLLLALVTATKLPGILFVLLCGLEYLRAYSWRLQKAFNPQIGWFFLAPTGLIIYSMYLYFVRGDAFGMFNAYHSTDDWTYHTLNINFIGTLWDSTLSGISDLIRTRAYDHFVNKILPLSALAAVFVSSVYLFFQKKSEFLPLVVTGIASIAMFSMNSNVVSVHRYVLVCLCMYLAIGVYCKTRGRLLLISILCACSFGVQLFLYSKFISGVFAG